MKRKWLVAFCLMAGCGGSGSMSCFSDGNRAATGWSAAEQLFRNDPAWVGGDAAYSIDLGQSRVLWLFGDSFISPTASGSRSGSPFARNTIAIQKGYDPTSAALHYHWRTDGNTPSAFFAAPSDGTWYWPGHGARFGAPLLVFLWRMKSSSGGLGFVADAPEAALIANPDDDPPAWQIQKVAVPQNAWGIFLGTGAVVVDQGYLYSMSCIEPGNHDVFLARWPVADAMQGQLADPEWATTVAGGWMHQAQLTAMPMRLFDQGHTEFSVHFDAASQQWIQIQPLGFPQSVVVMRTSPSLTGPWSAPRTVYTPPENSCSDLFTYAAKAHPEQKSPALGSAVAVTYATNSSSFATQVNNLALYFPRVIRLDPATATAGP